MPCASLGGAHGLVELFLDLDYILELEWICGDGHTLRIIPGDQNHPKAVSWFQISYSKLHFSLLCFKLQGRSWCIPPSVTTKLVDHRSVPTRRQPERITSYQLIQGHLKTWLAGRMEADERGGRLLHISFIPMARINPEKLLMTKWTAVEPKRKERHFIVTKLIRATDETIVACELEAVINKNNYEMDWRELKNTKVWKMGWE
jgi:tryptophan-rich hypothetical protein